MPGPLESVEIRHLVWRMFREPADCDYINARALLFANQSYQFYWSAAQAIEKYLKCALLQNGVSVSGYGHDIPKLLLRLLAIAGEHLPIMLVPPREIELRPLNGTLMGLSYAEPFVSFIERIASEGDSSNRYRHYSLIFRRSDLHKFDECCFQLRRLCFPLEIDYGGIGENYCDILRENPNFSPHLPLHTLNKSKVDSAWQEIAERYNFSFYPEKAKESGKYFGGGGSVENSAVFLAIKARDAETLRWAIDNVYFSRHDKAQIEDTIDRIGAGNP